MPVSLITGRPGQGKTLLAVKELFEKHIPDARENGRQIFTNINGLVLAPDEAPYVTRIDYTEFQYWPDEAPEGALYILDECQFSVPVRHSTKRPPPWVEQLTVHRHRGLDFVFITQHPSLIDSLLRHMVTDHRHVFRPRGLSYSVIKGWDGCNDSPEPNQLDSMADVVRLRLPKQFFDKYKSAAIHNIKPRVPWRLIGTAAALCVVIAGGGWFALRSVDGVAQGAQNMSAAATGAAGGAYVPLCQAVGQSGGVPLWSTPAGLVASPDAPAALC